MNVENTLLTNIVVKKGYSPYIDSTTGTWWEYDYDTKQFVDTGVTPSSYQYAVQHGYEGTEEEWAELVASVGTLEASAATSAQTASSAATSAAQSRDTASAAATTASNASVDAQASKTAAQSAAGSASGSAQQASASAQSATQSAASAGTSAQTASSAATSAQTSAQTAQTAASNAATSEQNASDSAQQAANSMSNAALSRLNAQVAANAAQEAQAAAEDAKDAAEAAAQTLVVDDTLTQEDQPAEAKATGDAIDSLQGALAADFAAGVYTAQRSIIFHDGKFYLKSGTEGASASVSSFSPTDWTEVKLTDLLVNAKNRDKSMQQTDMLKIAPIYTNDTYKVGDLRWIRNMSNADYVWTLYKCIVQIDTAENFNSDHWIEATLDDVLSDLRDDVLDLKQDLSTKVVQKPLTNPDGTNGQLLRTKGDGTTEWSDVGTPTQEQVGTAVNSWLDEHPEATTTVEDGSLTEAKLSNDLKMKTVNNWVTPQMYGAVADGTTDDTVAIQAALDSGYNVLFPYGTYATTGVSITSNISVRFDNAKMIALNKYQDHVISVETSVYFYGNLEIDGKSKSLCGAKFENCYGVVIEYIKVSYCLVWGVLIDRCPHTHFNTILGVTCGKSINLTVTNIDRKTVHIDSSLTEEQEALLGSEYNQNMLFYNATEDETRPSGYTNHFTTTVNIEEKIITLRDVTANLIPSADTTFSVTFLLGGCIGLTSSNFSQIIFGKIDTRLSPTGMMTNSTYGNNISAFYSQSDHIAIVRTNYCLGDFIGSISAEGLKTGILFASFNYDYSVIGARSTSYDYNFNAGNMLSITNGASAYANPVHAKHVLRRIIPRYHDSGEIYVLTEQSPDTLLLNKNQFKINLYDKNQYIKQEYNPWGVKHIYFYPNNAFSSITVTLHNDLINDGYTIEGGTDGTLVFTPPSAWFLVRVFKRNKVFTLTAEPITKVVPST